MAKRNTRNRLYALLVLLGGASYGLVSPIVKLAYIHGFSAQDVTSGQFYYAAVILWLFTAFTGLRGQRSRRRARLSVGDWRRLLLLGVFGTATAVFYYQALTMLPAWMAIILLFQFSWMTFAIAYLVTRKAPTRGEWRGILLIAAGTLLANIHGFHAGQALSARGFVFGLCAGATYASFLYVNEGISTQTSPFFRAAVVTSISAILISFIYAPSLALVRASIHGMWLFGILIGLFSQAIPTSLFGIGIPRVGGAASAILGSVELPVAVILAAVIVHEHVLWTGWLGVALIMIGIAVGQRRTAATQ